MSASSFNLNYFNVFLMLFLGVPSSLIATSPPDPMLPGNFFLRTLQVRQSAVSEGTHWKSTESQMVRERDRTASRSRFLTRIHDRKDALILPIASSICFISISRTELRWYATNHVIRLFRMFSIVNVPGWRRSSLFPVSLQLFWFARLGSSTK